MPRSAPFITTFDHANDLTALPDSEICVANNWSGDYATAQGPRRQGGDRDQSGQFCAQDRGTLVVRHDVHAV